MRVLPWLALGATLAGCAADTFVGGDGGADGGDDAGTQLACGASSCGAGERCCIDTNNGAAQYACQTACTPAQGGGQLSSLACTSGADCPGQLCCIQRANGGNVSACASSCTGQAALCDPSAADAGCPANAPCSSGNVADWGLPSGFGTCGGVGPP